MGKWNPIETAPKDGTVIDLWMNCSQAGGHRVTDAYWNEKGEHRTWLDGRWRDVDEPCWYAPNFDYDGADGCCETRRVYVDHPMQKKWVWDEPTHWMPLPPPPEG